MLITQNDKIKWNKKMPLIKKNTLLITQNNIIMCNTKMHHIKKFFCFLVSSFLSFVLWDYFFTFKFLINFLTFSVIIFFWVRFLFRWIIPLHLGGPMGLLRCSSYCKPAPPTVNSVSSYCKLGSFYCKLGSSYYY